MIAMALCRCGGRRATDQIQMEHEMAKIGPYRWRVGDREMYYMNDIEQYLKIHFTRFPAKKVAMWGRGHRGDVFFIFHPPQRGEKWRREMIFVLDWLPIRLTIQIGNLILWISVTLAAKWCVLCVVCTPCWFSDKQWGKWNDLTVVSDLSPRVWCNKMWAKLSSSGTATKNSQKRIYDYHACAAWRAHASLEMIHIRWRLFHSHFRPIFHPLFFSFAPARGDKYLLN